MYPGRWYARVAAGEVVDLEGLAEHMAAHTSTFSKGEIFGILTDMVTCIRELCMDGKQVKIPNLAIFSLGITTNPASTAADYNIAKQLREVRLKSRATGRMRIKDLVDNVRIEEVSDYSSAKTAAKKAAATETKTEG